MKDWITNAVLTSLVLAFLGVSAVFAHSGATGVVKTRMETMKSIGGEMKRMAAMVRGKSDFDTSAGAASAAAIAVHGGQFPHLFPNGSNPPPSEALDLIWRDWPAFEKQGQTMVDAADALAAKFKVARQAKDVMPEFKALAATCKSCHESYRLKKQ